MSLVMLLLVQLILLDALVLLAQMASVYHHLIINVVALLVIAIHMMPIVLVILVQLSPIVLLIILLLVHVQDVQLVSISSTNNVLVLQLPIVIP